MTQFPKDLQEVKDFQTLVSPARFDRYIASCNGDLMLAVKLYTWNAKISQAFYLPLQIWEISLRNQTNRFLCWKFQDGAWPYNEQKAIRQLNRNDKLRLAEAKKRQERARQVSQASTDAIVADLSLGFWVSMLTTGYNAKFVWRYNLEKVFPNAPQEWRDKNAKTPLWDHNAAHTPCSQLLTLRNRVAHHEPIYNMDLDALNFELKRAVAAMSEPSANYLQSLCTIDEVMKQRPQL